MHLEVDSIRELEWSNFSDFKQCEPTFHNFIFSPSERDGRLSRNATWVLGHSAIDQKIKRAVLNSSEHQFMITGDRVSGSAEVSATASWGGSEGTTVSISASATVEDERGNSASIQVEQKSDGSGSATASASHTDR